MTTAQHPTLFIHPGMHKTGTTYFQIALDMSPDILKASQTAYLTRHAYREKLGPVLEALDENVITRAQAVAQTHEILVPLLDPLAQDAATIVLSNEDLAGTLRLDKQDRLYPGFENRMDVLNTAFSKHFNIKIGLSLCPPAEFLESAALQTIQQGILNNPTDFINAACLITLSPKRLVTAAYSLFGKDNTTVVLKNNTPGHRNHMTRAFLESLGLAHLTNSLHYDTGAMGANPSLNDRGLRIAMAAMENGKPEGWDALRAYLAQHHSTKQGPRASLLTDNVRTLITEFYAADMAWLKTQAIA